MTALTFNWEEEKFFFLSKKAKKLHVGGYRIGDFPVMYFPEEAEYVLGEACYAVIGQVRK